MYGWHSIWVLIKPKKNKTAKIESVNGYPTIESFIENIQYLQKNRIRVMIKLESFCRFYKRSRIKFDK